MTTKQLPLAAIIQAFGTNEDPGPIRKIIESNNLLPVKTQLLIAMNIQRLQEVYDHYAKLRDSLLIKYGDKERNGGFSINHKHKNWQSFVAEHEGLVRTVVDVPIMEVDPEGINLDFRTVAALRFMWKFEEPQIEHFTPPQEKETPDPDIDK